MTQSPAPPGHLGRRWVEHFLAGFLGLCEVGFGIVWHDGDSKGITSHSSKSWPMAVYFALFLQFTIVAILCCVFEIL